MADLIDKKLNARLQKRRELEEVFGAQKPSKLFEKIPTLKKEDNLPQLELRDYYKTLRENKYKNPSNKRGSGLPEVLKNYFKRIETLEKQGYRFDVNVVNQAIQASKKYLGQNLSKAESETLKKWTTPELKKIAILTPTSTKPRKTKEVKTEKQQQIVQEITPSDNLQNLPPEYVQELPSMEEVIQSQVNQYMNTIKNPDLRRVYEMILLQLDINTIKDYIEKGYLPMWVADSDALLELKAQINLYPEEIQRMINNVYDLFSVEQSIRR